MEYTLISHLVLLVGCTLLFNLPTK